MVQEELKILHKVIETVSYNLNLEQILEHIIKIVNDVAKSDSCLLYLISDNHLVLSASKNPHPKIIGNIRMKMGEGITGWTAEHKKMVHIPEKAYEDSRFHFFTNLPEDKFESFLSLPILYKDKVAGVINVQHRKARKYSEHEIKLLETLAKATGGAIEHARLFSETQILKDALETRKILEKAKGILMEKLRIGEKEAHRLLHRKAMNSRKSIREVAEAILLIEELPMKN